MAADLFVYIGATIGALLPIVNPVSAAPVFVSVTARASAQQRTREARRATVYTCAILLASFFVGNLILSFFGITLPVLRIGGGLVVTRIGFRMLEGSTEPGAADVDGGKGIEAADVAFSPVAMPMLAGPGSMASVIAMATEARTLISDVGVVIGIVVVSLISWGVLRFSGGIVRWMGPSGMQVLTRVMGLILICIGIRFVATGIVVGLTAEPMVEVLRTFISDLQSGG